MWAYGKRRKGGLILSGVISAEEWCNVLECGSLSFEMDAYECTTRGALL